MKLIHEYNDRVFQGFRILAKEANRKDYQLKTRTKDNDKEQEKIRNKEKTKEIVKERTKIANIEQGIQQDSQEMIPDLVTQPDNMQVNLIIEESIQEEGSWIGITTMEQWTDLLQEKINLKTERGFYIRGITQKKCIITLPSLENLNNENKKILEEWFVEIRDSNHRELVHPRLAWIHCKGLPISAWNQGNLQAIFQDWGQVVSAPFVPLICNMYQKEMVAIYTLKVLEIDETIKVWIQGKGYWLRIKKSHSFFENREGSSIRSQEQGIGIHSTRDNSQAEVQVDKDYNSESTFPNNQVSGAGVTFIDNDCPSETLELVELGDGLKILGSMKKWNSRETIQEISDETQQTGNNVV